MRKRAVSNWQKLKILVVLLRLSGGKIDSSMKYDGSIEIKENVDDDNESAKATE